jgi:catechol 2,3-dioxygenase-like lactoylglutathione lyase family enzyme
MSVAIDHVGIPAADPEASARFLGDILGEGLTTPEGPDGDMFNLSVGHSALTYFELPTQEPHHIAFRVTESVFVGAIERLRARDMPFGNDPGDTSNRQTADPLGGLGRIYFRESNGYLFELFVPTAL